jgi:hypothetical protein
MSVFVVFGAYVNAEAFASLACAGSPPMPSTLIGKEIPLNARRIILICSPCQLMAWTKNLICSGRIITNDKSFY